MSFKIGDDGKGRRTMRWALRRVLHGKAFRIACVASCALVLWSCFQLGLDDITLEYIPRAVAVQSEPFTVAGEELLIVTVYGGTLRQDLSPGHFSLTRNNRAVPMQVPPIRGGDSHVLFGFQEPLEPGSDYRITVSPAAIGSGIAIRVVVR
ncbi:MAG: hypothetical protein FWD88_03185, partial [Treponema sp.]|nr:hypothetical protein [Treponema sp.]